MKISCATVLGVGIGLILITSLAHLLTGDWNPTATIVGALIQAVLTAGVAWFAVHHDLYLRSTRPITLSVFWDDKSPYKATVRSDKVQPNPGDEYSFLRLRVENTSSRDAENVQVVVEEVWHLKPSGDHEAPMESFVPGRLIWTHTRRSPMINLLPSGSKRFVDVGGHGPGGQFGMSFEAWHHGIWFPRGDYAFLLSISGKGGVFYKAWWKLHVRKNFVDLSLTPPTAELPIN